MALFFCEAEESIAGEPRYIFFNLAPGNLWKQNDAKTVTKQLFTNVADAFESAPNPELRIGVSFIFSVLENPPDAMTPTLLALLKNSDACDVPILITLDGQNWWENRPDLWNWWDPQKPGFDPDNARNVEWTGWDPSSAIKISWRNWGSQIRIAPAPNIASPRVIEELQKAFHAMIPLIAQWYGALPVQKQYLFGGLKVGWESSIGYNAYYYPDGNGFKEKWPDDASHDPRGGLDHTLGVSGGLAQLGYAAVRTAKLKTNGELTRRDLAELMNQYIQMLSRTARELGLPTSLIYTHQGGTYAPYEKNMPFWPAINEWSTPGWSFYGTDPADIKPLGDELGLLSRTRWAAAEWWWGAPDSAGWRDHFERTLRWRECRFICVYNWDQAGFSADKAGRQAVLDLVPHWKDERQ